MPPLSIERGLADRADVCLVSIDDSMLVPHPEYAEEFVDVVSEKE